VEDAHLVGRDQAAQRQREVVGLPAGRGDGEDRLMRTAGTGIRRDGRHHEGA
jgi:hypothetical protein